MVGSPTFLAFLIIFAAFLLLTLAAAIRSVWHFFRPQAAAAAGIAKRGEPSPVADGLLLIGVATSWCSVAAGWTGQFTVFIATVAANAPRQDCRLVAGHVSS